MKSIDKRVHDLRRDVEGTFNRYGFSLAVDELVLENILQAVRAQMHPAQPPIQEATVDPGTGTAEWLREQHLADRPRLAEGLKVEAGWELAVETVLGADLQAVLVDDFGDFDLLVHVAFGAPPQHLGLNLPPRHVVRPREGRLVLFPSCLWHGTVPFSGDQPRLSVAFDIAPA